MGAIYCKWRTGRSVGRTIYACPSDDKNSHILIGLMDTREIAAHVIEAHNAWLAEKEKDEV